MQGEKTNLKSMDISTFKDFTANSRSLKPSLSRHNCSKFWPFLIKQKALTLLTLFIKL